MQTPFHFELDQSKQRLDYYTRMMARTQANKKSSVQKWIEIYSERIQKLERQIAKAERLAAAAAAAEAEAKAHAEAEAKAAPRGLKVKLSAKPKAAKAKIRKRA